MSRNILLIEHYLELIRARLGLWVVPVGGTSQQRSLLGGPLTHRVKHVKVPFVFKFEENIEGRKGQ